MDYWLVFWTVLLVAALAVFAVLAVAVSIGGLFDIKAMFRSIAASEGNNDTDKPAAESE
jgi:hypothetical protein